MSLKSATKRKKSLALPKKAKSMRLTSVGSELAILSTCEKGEEATKVMAAEGQALSCSRANTDTCSIDSQTGNCQVSPICFSQQEVTLSIETAICPICSIELTMKTRLQRLAHANTCLENEENSGRSISATVETTHIPTMEEADNGPDECVICGKDIRNYGHQAREQHTNRCLDEIVLEQQVIQASKKTAEKYRIDNTYGNKPIPSKYAVTNCPCCHVDWTGNSLSLRRKMLHMKSCSRSNNISIQELGRRLQWSNWGLHTRPAPKNAISVPDVTEEEEEVKRTESAKPEDPGPSKTFLYDEAFVLCTSEDENFEMTAPKPRITSSVYQKKTKSRRKENDEDLQLAIALSMSMKKEPKKTKSRSAGKATAASKNESCILSLEDSKIVVLRNLENLLCAPKIISKDLDEASKVLPPSMLAKAFERSTSQRGNKNPQLLWAIASSDNTKCDCFTTDFLAQFMVSGIVKLVSNPTFTAANLPLILVYAKKRKVLID